MLSQFGWQPTVCSKNGAAATVEVVACEAGKFACAPQERKRGAAYQNNVPR